MRRIRIPVANAFTWVIIGLSIGYFFLELRQTEDDLRQTQQALARSNADLTDTVEARNALIDDVNALGVQLNVLVEDRNILTRDLAEAQTERHTLNNQVRELWEENRILDDEKSVLTQEYEHLEGAHEQLTATHEQLGASHEALQVSHESLQTSHESLDSSYKDLDLRHTELQQAVGTVEDLEMQAGNLRTEITQLEERRRPLILAREEPGWFYCTGSMEPKLTCLDTATWLHDFQPEDIVIGATISFQSRACWSNEPRDSWTAHRVMDIEVTDGVHYYWPQGDANSGPDGCWVPESSVRGYIIEIHKNTRPENATLRNNVNAANAARNAARDTRDAAWDAYEGERAAYVALRQRYGCSSDLSVTCYVSAAAYDALVQALQATNRAYDTYDHAYDIWKQASDYYWDCWYRNAKDSEYPGHIPYKC